MSDNKKETTSASTQYFRLMGYYNINDIKYDLLKIIAPHDGYMYNRKDTDKVRSLFESFLGDLRKAYKIREFVIRDTEKDNAITYDLEIRIHKDRSPKKLKIHVGRLLYTSKAA